MHTQNIKIAASESTGRWGENRLTRTIAEQKSLLAYLCGLWNQQLDERDEAEQIFGTLERMSKNVLDVGVLDWNRPKPLISLSVIQPWVQAKAHAVRLYGETGAAAWESSRKHIADGMIFESAMMQMKAN